MSPSDILWPVVVFYAAWAARVAFMAWLSATHRRPPDIDPSGLATKQELADVTARLDGLELAGALKSRPR